MFWPPEVRSVAAIEAATTPAAPASSRARAHSERVAPVVTTSSTTRHLRPATARRWRAGTHSAPCRLAARCATPRPAWSDVARAWTSTPAPIRQASAAPRSLPATTSASSPSSGTPPRTRLERRDDGAGTARTGCPAQPVCPSAARTAPARSGARTRPRSPRPSSFQAVSAGRSGPAYAPHAYVTGSPRGRGTGSTRRGPSGKRTASSPAAHREHQRTPGVRQAAHSEGRTRSSRSRRSTRPPDQTRADGWARAPRARDRRRRRLGLWRVSVSAPERAGRCPHRWPAT